MESREKLSALLSDLEQRSNAVQRSSSESNGGDESLAARMRHVLHLLFQDCSSGGKGILALAASASQNCTFSFQHALMPVAFTTAAVFSQLKHCERTLQSTF